MATKHTPAAAERARMAAVMALPGAKTQAHLAGQLAVSTDLTPVQIGDALESAAGRGTFAHLKGSAIHDTVRDMLAREESASTGARIAAAGGTGARR